jgi:hypothetical protein
LLKISMHVPLILLKTTGTLEGIGSLATYISFLVRSEITLLSPLWLLCLDAEI